MRVMMPLVSLLLLVMATWGSQHINLASVEGIVISNSATSLIEYWQTVLPNSPMPLAILELLAPSADTNGRTSKLTTKDTGASFVNARKLGLHSTTKTDEQKLPLIGWHSWLQETSKTHEQKLPLIGWRSWLQETSKTDEQKLPLIGWRSWLQETSRGDKKAQVFRETNGHSDKALNVQDGQDGEGHMSNMVVFLEEALAPGSTVTSYIQSSATSGAPLLQRDVVESIPMSTKNFTDIMMMFAPASNSMADDIWTTLNICENPRPVKGEKKTCVLSLESMVEYVSSILGPTQNLQAFSSPDVPVDGAMSERGYMVAAVRRVTEEGDTVTCHGMTFPFAMFMCHAVNPTRVYSVMLESEDGGAKRMEALAVCHLDTSDFDPMKMPRHVKPGEAALCHFVARDAIVWASVGPAAAAA